MSTGEGSYSRSRYDDSPFQITNSHYLSVNTFVETLDNNRYIYFVAEKLNDSQLIFNQRFFMLTNNSHFGYASKFKHASVPFMNSEKLCKMKVEYPVEEMGFEVGEEGAVLEVRIERRRKEGKQGLWKLRFGNESMREQVESALIKAKQERMKEIQRGGSLADVVSRRLRSKGFMISHQAMNLQRITLQRITLQRITLADEEVKSAKQRSAESQHRVRSFVEVSIFDQDPGKKTLLNFVESNQNIDP